MKIDVLDSSLINVVFTVDVSSEIFSRTVDRCILHLCIRWQDAKKSIVRMKYKSRSHISGSTVKPHKQKGTGKARLGTKRAPQCRGGGVVFGSSISKNAIKINKKVFNLGVRMSLSNRYACNSLHIVKDLDKVDKSLFSDLIKEKKKVLLLVESGSELFLKYRNYHFIDILPYYAVNVRSVLLSDVIYIAESSLEDFSNRLLSGIRKGNKNVA